MAIDYMAIDMTCDCYNKKPPNQTKNPKITTNPKTLFEIFHLCFWEIEIPLVQLVSSPDSESEEPVGHRHLWWSFRAAIENLFLLLNIKCHLSQKECRNALPKMVLRINWTIWQLWRNSILDCSGKHGTKLDSWSEIPSCLSIFNPKSGKLFVI